MSSLLVSQRSGLGEMAALAGGSLEVRFASCSEWTCRAPVSPGNLEWKDPPANQLAP
jgi:hypothetical protein